jgi:hypothetical protein
MHWHSGRTSAPGYLEQCRQLTQVRAEHAWLAAGSQTVQQQALRDFAQAVVAFFDPANPARRPTWRKAGRDEGFRIVGQRGQQWDVRRLGRKTGEVWVPKAGWVRFRWSRPVPPEAKSYRVTRDPAGRWHIAFAAVPRPVLHDGRPSPGTVLRVTDRGLRARQIWLLLPDLTEQRWRDRFGLDQISRLRDALVAVAARLDPGAARLPADPRRGAAQPRPDPALPPAARST